MILSTAWAARCQVHLPFWHKTISSSSSDGNMPSLLQILVELADLQDQEVGDGTTSVVILAAELLKRANDLVRAKIHPTSIISGYRLAMREVRAARKTYLLTEQYGISRRNVA